MGIIDHGTGTQTLAAPSLAAWAASVAAVLDNSDTPISDRLAALPSGGGAVGSTLPKTLPFVLAATTGAGSTITDGGAGTLTAPGLPSWYTKAGADAALASVSTGASPIEIHVGAPTGTNDHVLVDAAIAKALTSGQPSRLIFSPGVYMCSAPLTSLFNTSMVEFHGSGARRPIDLGAARTEIRYTGTGAGTFINARMSIGFTVSGVAITHSSSSFTGTLIDISGGDGGKPSYCPRFENCYVGSWSSDGVTFIQTATLVNLGGVVSASFQDCSLNGGNVGIDGSGVYSNSVVLSNVFFAAFASCAVLNPRWQWTFTGCIFEIDCQTLGTQTVEALSYVGCGWWDGATGSKPRIDIANGSGISISGGYWEPRTDVENLLRISNSVDGLSITGLKSRAFGATVSPMLTMTAGAVLTGLHLGGNSFSDCVDGLAAAQAVATITHSPSRATGELRALGNSGAALTVPLVKVATVTLTANTTVTLPTVPAGYEHRIRFLLKQDATGSRTVTWPASVKWPGGTAPTLTTTAARTDVVELSTVNAGTTWLGSVIAQNYS